MVAGDDDAALRREDAEQAGEEARLEQVPLLRLVQAAPAPPGEEQRRTSARKDWGSPVVLATVLLRASPAVLRNSRLRLRAVGL